MAHLMWTGSDSLFASRLLGGRKFPTKKSKYFYFLGYTIFAKIADLFVQKHYVVSEHMKENLKPLKLKKPIEVLIDPPKDVSHIKKIPHKVFNVLYCTKYSNNQPFTDWCYGYNIFCNVANYFANDDNVYFQVVDGEQNIDPYYELSDAYIRPNRSDGAPRMIMECEQLGIPYYHSKENPNEEDIINFIKDEIKKKQNG